MLDIPFVATLNLLRAPVTSSTLPLSPILASQYETFAPLLVVNVYLSVLIFIVSNSFSGPNF